MFLGEETFRPALSDARRKHFRATSLLQGEAGMQNWAFFLPPLCLADALPLPLSPRPATFPYYTQVEAVVGLGYTLRLGFNPGELIDFLLGWTTLDLCHDDISISQPPPSAADRQ